MLRINKSIISYNSLLVSLTFLTFQFLLPQCDPRSKEDLEESTKETHPRVHLLIYTPSRFLKQLLSITPHCFAILPTNALRAKNLKT